VYLLPVVYLLPAINAAGHVFDLYMCISVSVCPFYTLIFEILDLKTLFSVHVYCTSAEYLCQGHGVEVKVTAVEGHTSISEYPHLLVVHLRLKGSLFTLPLIWINNCKKSLF